MERLFFDGCKDKTLMQVLGQDNKYHRKTLLEEHRSIVAKPNASYFSHTTLKSGSSKNITDAILASLKGQNVSTDYIQVVGCNGTNGRSYSVIRRIL